MNIERLACLDENILGDTRGMHKSICFTTKGTPKIGLDTIVPTLQEGILGLFRLLFEILF